MPARSFADVDFQNRPTLVRADLNVPVGRDGTVEDEHRLAEFAPTLRRLRESGARTVVCSHLGRPDGAPSAEASLRQVVEPLSRLIGAPIQFVEDCLGAEVQAAAARVRPGEVLLVENLRFHAGEEENDLAFARQLSRLGTVFVNDAFGTLHRAHASIVGVPALLPSVPGPLVEREVECLTAVAESPSHPVGLVLGGAKVLDKLPLLERLLPQADVVCIGGALAIAFMRYRAGIDSFEGTREVATACAMIAEAEASGRVRLELPRDVIAAREFQGQQAMTLTHEPSRVPEGWNILDVGPHTVRAFTDALRDARTIVWNGPVGKFEDPSFAQGTIGLARALAELPARVLAGGGDTASAIRLAGVEDHLWHLSTGGGATLAMLSGEVLPGLAALGLQETERAVPAPALAAPAAGGI